MTADSLDEEILSSAFSDLVTTASPRLQYSQSMKAFLQRACHTVADDLPSSQQYAAQTIDDLSIGDLYSLAELSRMHLSREADKRNHRFRHLVGHANLLDLLTIRINNEVEDEEEEEEEEYETLNSSSNSISQQPDLSHQSFRPSSPQTHDTHILSQSRSGPLYEGSSMHSQPHVHWADMYSTAAPDHYYDSNSATEDSDSDSDSDSEIDSDSDSYSDADSDTSVTSSLELAERRKESAVLADTKEVFIDERSSRSNEEFDDDDSMVPLTRTPSHSDHRYHTHPVVSSTLSIFPTRDVKSAMSPLQHDHSSASDNESKHSPFPALSHAHPHTPRSQDVMSTASSEAQTGLQQQFSRSRPLFPLTDRDHLRLESAQNRTHQVMADQSIAAF